METGPELTITNMDYNTKFALFRAKRMHSGKYTITASNSSGEDVAEVDITVLGKPKHPKGPLDVSDSRRVLRDSASAHIGTIRFAANAICLYK